MKMYLCPFCGRKLQKVIEFGVDTCDNCGRVFDCTDFNKYLSVAWSVRREYIDDVEYLRERFDLDDEATEFISKHLIDSECSHDEFFKTLKQKFAL